MAAAKEQKSVMTRLDPDYFDLIACWLSTNKAAGLGSYTKSELLAIGPWLFMRMDSEKRAQLMREYREWRASGCSEATLHWPVDERLPRVQAMVAAKRKAAKPKKIL